MKEVDVVKLTVDYLKTQNWQLWINNDRIHSSLPENEYPRHFITIGSYIPDIVGYDQYGNIIAIEAKGENDHRKGIGQTLMYSLGTTNTYLALPNTHKQGIIHVARKYNFGLIMVGNKIEINRPTDNYIPFNKDIEQSMRLLKLGILSTNTLPTSLTLNQLLNYVAITTILKNPCNKIEIINHCKNNDFIKSNPERVIRGAKILGLITEDNKAVHLTSEGNIARILLFEENISDIETFQQFKKELGGHRHDPFYLYLPNMATFLRMIYEKIPYFMDFLSYIPKQDTPFKEIIKNILCTRPNMALNFLCKNSEKIKCLNFLTDSIVIENNNIEYFINNFMLRGIIDPFKKHLQGLGYLKPSPAHSGKLDDYDPATDYWCLM